MSATRSRRSCRTRTRSRARGSSRTGSSFVRGGAVAAVGVGAEEGSVGFGVAAAGVRGSDAGAGRHVGVDVVACGVAAVDDDAGEGGCNLRCRAGSAGRATRAGRAVDRGLRVGTVVALCHRIDLLLRRCCHRRDAARLAIRRHGRTDADAGRPGRSAGCALCELRCHVPGR
jgi:hypothetical protein